MGNVTSSNCCGGGRPSNEKSNMKQPQEPEKTYPEQQIMDNKDGSTHVVSNKNSGLETKKREHHSTDSKVGLSESSLVGETQSYSDSDEYSKSEMSQKESRSTDSKDELPEYSFVDESFHSMTMSEGGKSLDSNNARQLYDILQTMESELPIPNMEKLGEVIELVEIRDQIIKEKNDIIKQLRSKEKRMSVNIEYLDNRVKFLNEKSKCFKYGVILVENGLKFDTNKVESAKDIATLQDYKVILEEKADHIASEAMRRMIELDLEIRDVTKSLASLPQPINVSEIRKKYEIKPLKIKSATDTSDSNRSPRKTKKRGQLSPHKPLRSPIGRMFSEYNFGEEKKEFSDCSSSDNIGDEDSQTSYGKSN